MVGGWGVRLHLHSLCRIYTLEWWDVLQKRLAWALFVLLLSVLSELIFTIFGFINCPSLLPPPLPHSVLKFQSFYNRNFLRFTPSPVLTPAWSATQWRIASPRWKTRSLRKRSAFWIAKPFVSHLWTVLSLVISLSNDIRRKKCAFRLFPPLYPMWLSLFWCSQPTEFDWPELSLFCCSQPTILFHKCSNHLPSVIEKMTF